MSTFESDSWVFNSKEWHVVYFRVFAVQVQDIGQVPRFVSHQVLPSHFHSGNAASVN